MKSIYETTVITTGGREGRSISEDAKFELALSTPKALGGKGGEGTNPEQLFAAGYSACFIGAMQFVAAEQKLTLPSDVNVRATVGIGENPNGVGFAINVDLVVSIPGLDIDTAEKLIANAHQVCPYSNATRGNIDVRTLLI